MKKKDVLAMLAAGTVQDVIVITVLRANDVRTKQVLAQALFNLLARVDTREEMIANDVPLALVRLTKVEDPILNLLCTNMLRNLSCEAEKLSSKLLEMKVVKVMVDQCLSPSGGVQIKRKCAATLGNLASVPEILEKGLAHPESNVVSGIRSMAVAQDAETLEHVAAIAYHLAATKKGRDTLVRQDAVPTLVRLCDGGDAPARVRQLVVAALCHVSTELDALEQLARPSARGDFSKKTPFFARSENRSPILVPNAGGPRLAVTRRDDGRGLASARDAPQRDVGGLQPRRPSTREPRRGGAPRRAPRAQDAREGRVDGRPRADARQDFTGPDVGRRV